MKFLVKSLNFFLMVTLLGLVSQAFVAVRCGEVSASSSDKSASLASNGEEPAEKRSAYNSGNLDEAVAVVKANEYLDQLQQRLPFKLALTPRLFGLIMREQMKHNQNHLSESENSAESSNEQLEDDEDNTEYEEDNMLAAAKRALSKKESPSEQRNRDLRRQQAARWDIGFGKRAAPSQKAKSFMDALYGKRSSGQGGKHNGGKSSFGRKQQWDIQYGRK
jgi:hypothetical protein